ncbi:Lhx2 protein, partial [Aphelenchoides avenae]
MLFLSALDECSDPLLASLAGTGAILDRTHAAARSDPLSSLASSLPHYGIAGSSFTNVGNMASFSTVHDLHRANLDNTSTGEKSIFMPPTSACGACGEQITEKSFLLVGDRSWHTACARCSACEQNLDSFPTCYYKNGQLYCKRDYILQFWKRCQRCSCIIEPGDLVMTSLDRFFHVHCFTCVVCTRVLRQGEIYVVGEGGSLLCREKLLSDGFEQDRSSGRSSRNGAAKTGRQSSGSQHGSGTGHSADANGDGAYMDCASTGEEDNSLPNGRTKRMRTSFKHHQLRTMKTYFNLNHNPDAKDLKQLAQKTGLTKRVLQVWFQNARAKYRRSQHSQRDGIMSSPGSMTAGLHVTTSEL